MITDGHTCTWLVVFMAQLASCFFLPIPVLEAALHRTRRKTLSEWHRGETTVARGRQLAL
jgi:hypothetical protein